MDFDLTEYWDQRYRSGGDSGAGSRGDHAKMKAAVVNKWVVGSVLDIGSGDGQQAQLYDFDDYLGVDISEKAIELAQERNPDKTFQLEIPEPRDTHLSIDVMFHQVTDKAFQAHMNLLFSAKKRVIVYSSNYEERGGRHVRHRMWTPSVPHWWTLVYIGEGVTGRHPKEFYIFDRS